MVPASAPHAYSSRGSLRQRVTSAVLAIAVAVLLIVLLVLAGVIPQVFVPVGSRALSTFNVSGGSATPAPSPAPKPQRKAAARQTPRQPARTLPPPIVPMPVRPSTGVIVLSRDDFAAA